MKIKCAGFETKVGNCKENASNIMRIIDDSIIDQTDILLFQEMTICGYSCGDMFYNKSILDSAIKSLITIRDHTIAKDIIVVLGLPLIYSSNIYNCSAVIYNGKILGIIPKNNLSNTNDCNECRWFSSFDYHEDEFIIIDGLDIPFGDRLLFKDMKLNISIGVTIGENFKYTIDKNSTLNNANVILNLSAGIQSVGSNELRKDLIKTCSLLNNNIYIYCSGNSCESTTDFVHSDYKIIVANGKVLAETNSMNLVYNIDINYCLEPRYKKKFYDKTKTVNSTIVYFSKNKYLNSISPDLLKREPFINSLNIDDVCEEIIDIQKKGLYKKMRYSEREKLIIGISGGLDSTVALLSIYKLFCDRKWDLKNIIGVTMPGPGTTSRTYNNSLKLMRELGITIRDISILNVVNENLIRIGHDMNNYDITYEQTQSRERTKILMDLANQENGIVIGTGDLSEYALGWMTYSGDQISMYGLNCGIPKTIMHHLMDYYVRNSTEKLSIILNDIRSTPVSPELLPLSQNGKQTQKTEDLIGPYIIHDFFLYHLLKNNLSIESIYNLAILSFKEYDSNKIKTWLKIFVKRFFTRQFKRTCFPDGIQVFNIGLSPRTSWKMPSDFSCEELLMRIEEL